MKYFLVLSLIYSSFIHASPLVAIEKSIGYGTFSGQIESGEKCSVEIDKVSASKIRLFIFNPRVSRLEITLDDHLVYLEDAVRISKPVVEENGARIINTLVIKGREVGIERTFCTYKCWVSMTPCFLDYY